MPTKDSQKLMIISPLGINFLGEYTFEMKKIAVKYTRIQFYFSIRLFVKIGKKTKMKEMPLFNKMAAISFQSINEEA